MARCGRFGPIDGVTDLRAGGGTGHDQGERSGEMSAIDAEMDRLAHPHHHADTVGPAGRGCACPAPHRTGGSNPGTPAWPGAGPSGRGAAGYRHPRNRQAARRCERQHAGGEGDQDGDVAGVHDDAPVSIHAAASSAAAACPCRLRTSSTWHRPRSGWPAASAPSQGRSSARARC